MANTDITRNKIRSKLSAIKKISDNPKSLVDNSFDPYKDNLSSTPGIIKKNLNSFNPHTKGTTKNRKDIFSEIIDISNGFLGTEKEDPANTKLKPLSQLKIFKYSGESVRRTLYVSRQIINDELQNTLFSGIGICDPNNTIGQNSIDMSPKSFDFINMLKISPDSITGKLAYESEFTPPTNEIKFNRVLYENFDLGSPYPFISKNNNLLFNLNWNSGTQEYNVSSLDSTQKIGEFIDDYYNSIEFPNIEDVYKNAIEMLLGGDSAEPSSFLDGMKNMGRLMTKIFSICGSPINEESPLLSDATTLISEDEYDIENYFDFDDIEGIDIDDEESRLKRVLKFVDCNNFETNFNANHSEDYAYNLGKMNLNENVINTLNKASRDAYEESGASIPFDSFQTSLMTSFIFKLPRAIISSILSPKMFFPIALTYRLMKSEVLTAKELMRKLYNLFYNIIRKIYWVFIKEFWRFIKKDLLKFVKIIAQRIIVNKLKKIRSIIMALITLIKRALEKNIQSCTEIFNVMLNTITTALNMPIRLPIPGLLLVLSELLPGYSNDRAYMNIIERLEASGINTGPIYGTENKLPALIKSIIDGHAEEFDTNSYVKVGLKPGVIPSGPGGAIVSPLVEGVGKIF